MAESVSQVAESTVTRIADGATWRATYLPAAPRRCSWCHGPMVGADVYPEMVHPTCELEWRQIIEPMYRRTMRRRLAVGRRG